MTAFESQRSESCCKFLVHFKSVFLKFAEKARFLPQCCKQNPLKVSRSLIIYTCSIFSGYGYTYVFKMYCFIQEVLIGGRKLLIIYATARSGENGEFALAKIENFTSTITVHFL